MKDNGEVRPQRVTTLIGAALTASLLAGFAVPAAAEPSGTLTVAWPRVFSFVDVPSKNGGRQGERLVWMGVHESALEITPDEKIVPKLAESWSVSEDGLVHTLKLRPGVQFHGGYGEATAEDWKYTADDQWAGKPVSNHGGQFLANSSLKEVKVVDKYTIQFILNQPNAFFREYYGAIRDDVALAVYSKKRADEMGEKAVTELPDGGTGPYQVDSWTADDSVVLKAFPDYWGEQPAYETIKIVQISEPSTVMAALETGQVDAAKIPVTSRARAEAAGLKIASAGVGFANLIFAGQFCYKEFDGETLPPRPAYDPSLPWVGDCDDPDSMEKARTVRHAMSMAVDRKALVQAIAGGHGRPTYVEMLQGAFGDRYMKDEWVTPFDPEKATKLIADAGYPDGFDFDFICMGTGHPLQNEFCEATAAMWSNIGLRPQIRNVSTEALRKQQVERTLNAVRMEVRTGTSPIPEARGFGELPNAAFNSGYEMPGLAELVRKAYVATSDAELDKIREQEFEWSFYNALSIPLAEFDEIYAYNPEKIASWDRTPFNGHSEEIMDFESIEKP